MLTGAGCILFFFSDFFVFWSDWLWVRAAESQEFWDLMDFFSKDA